jgi:hypothetical protein
VILSPNSLQRRYVVQTVDAIGVALEGQAFTSEAEAIAAICRTYNWSSPRTRELDRGRGITVKVVYDAAARARNADATPSDHELDRLPHIAAACTVASIVHSD